MTKTATRTTNPAKSNPSKLPPIAYILVGIGVLALGSQVFKGGQPGNPLAPKLRISSGEQVLITADATDRKQQGIQAIQTKDFDLAQKKFEQSLQKFSNDPETLIYLNNAKAGKDALSIAVSVPISSNLNVAQEILRGVAQAQNDVNQQGGIAGRSLKVTIADDANDPELAKQVATALTQDPQILAVVGHNASNASLVAAPIYQKAGLLMISPTSSTNQLSGFGSYILRTIPSTNFIADTLAEYVVKTEGKTKFAACFDQDAPDNISYKDAFLAALANRGGQFVPIPCNFNAPDFNPTEVIRQAMSSGVQGILLAPHIDRLDKAIAIAEQNQGKISLYSSPTMYTIKTLQDGKANMAGLILPVVWHPQQSPNQTFPTQAKQLWGGTVNWRTATAYDATQAIATGLAQATTRQDLQIALRNPNFTAPGTGGAIRFLPSGDRQITPILVQVKPSATGYEFIPLKPSATPPSPDPI